MKQAIFRIVNTEYEWLTHIKIDPEYIELVPVLSDEEYARLKESIASVGLYEPLIINTEGVLLDGHHRFKVVKELGWSRVNVETKHFETRNDEEIYVIETNVIRRHLNQYQKTIMALKLEPLYQERSKQNQGTRTDLGNIVPNLEQSKEWERKTEAQAAKAVGLGKTTYQTAKQVIAQAPEDIKQAFAAGKKSASAALRETKHSEKIEQAKKKIPTLIPPNGPFDVIVVDPPWPYGNTYDADGDRSACPYPEISLEALSLIELPANDNAILWLWTTNAFMHEAYHLIDVWGFAPKTILTWAKDKMGLGRWLRGKTEHCILAVKGTPIIDLKNQTTLLEAPTRGHSTKPDEFYDLVDSLCIGTKVDWFSRRERPGWAVFGTMELNDK